jgi:hypothetical protein
MATYDSNLFRKNLRQRGLYGGKPQAVTGQIRVGIGGSAVASSIATTDLLRFMKLGENCRPTRIIIVATPISGTPVITNGVFSVGVQQPNANSFTRPDGTVYPAITTSATALVASMTIDADNMKQEIEIKRPAADNVANYAPYNVTLTPITSAFSVAGGTLDLSVTVEFLGEQRATGLVYTDYVNQNVNNQT